MPDGSSEKKHPSKPKLRTTKKDSEEKASKTDSAKDTKDDKAKKHPTPRARLASHVKNLANQREIIIPPDQPEEKEEEPRTGMKEISDPAPQIKRRQLYKENPRVFYPNVDSLSRPSHLPSSARLMIGIIIGVAIIVAAIIFFLYYDASKFAPEREQEAVAEAISEANDLSLPNLLGMVDKTNQEVFDELKDAGGTYYEKVAVSDASSQCEIIKLPEGISVVEAAAMYSTGISKIKTLEAISLLDGLWDLELDRRNGENISLHYVDFNSGSVEAAIKEAKRLEELDRGTETDSGEDDGFGNTYATGTIMINGNTYGWTVSALKLTSFYSLSNIPDSVAYVGIRIKSTA